MRCCLEVLAVVVPSYPSSLELFAQKPGFLASGPGAHFHIFHHISTMKWLDPCSISETICIKKEAAIVLTLCPEKKSCHELFAGRQAEDLGLDVQLPMLI